MALLDLHSELEKDSVRIDDSSQKKVADAVLLLIEDTSAEVQGAAVKWFEIFNFFFFFKNKFKKVLNLW